MHSTRTGKILPAAILGMVVGAIVTGLLYSYPKVEVTRHRYCLDCATFEQTYDEGVVLGATHARMVDHGPIGALLGHSPAEPHEHRFSDWTTLFPTFGVPPEHPEIAEQVQRIRVLEKDPHAISLFEQAMRNDRERAQRLLRTIIAPGSASANDVIRKLDGDAPWPEKWAAVDAALAARR
ncbi:MAG: hypothetical protein IPK74_28070 [Deltaproteobacteria bacterium]|nr:hypothetical protein [Deltaproteobacteria bacterium]